MISPAANSEMDIHIFPFEGFGAIVACSGIGEL